MLAACRDDRNTVGLLLQRSDVNVNCQDIHSNTALTLAVFTTHQSVAEILLQDQTVNIHIANLDGERPLTVAANESLMSMLLAKLSFLNTMDDSESKVALTRAVKRNDIGIVRVLLEHDVSVHGVDKDDRTLLHTTAAAGNAEIMNLLIDRRLAVDAQDSCGKTPLHEAARAGRTEIIAALLAAHANASVEDKTGRTPLVVARQNANSMSHFHSMALLDPSLRPAKPEQINPHARDLPTWSLAKIGGPELSSELQTREKDRWDLTEQDPDTGNSALHFAVSIPRIKFLESLLTAGVQQDCINHARQTPLHLAVSGDHRRCLEVIKLLLQHPKTPLASRDERGFTPLQVALRLSRFTTAVILLEAGADIQDIEYTFLHYIFIHAVELQNVKVAKMLIEHGADQLKPGPQGITARQIAREHGNVEMLRVLNKNKSFFIPIRSPNIDDDSDDDGDKGKEEMWATPPQSPITIKTVGPDTMKLAFVART